jgi:hypothetical protein
MLQRGFALVIGAGVVIGSLVGPAMEAGAVTTANLIQNPGAEAGTGGNGGVFGVPKWTRSTGTHFTAVKYGAPGFPTHSTPGPTTRGKNFFAGGPAQNGMPAQVAAQTVTIPAGALATIDAGHAEYNASAYLGGKGSQGDDALVEVDFKDAGGNFLGSSIIVGPVTAADRHNQTKLLRRSQVGVVPVGARTAYVQLILQRVEPSGYNDAYADNLSLTITQP